MADFKFLRVNPVNLARYLPAFLYKDPHFTAVQKALQEEHENQRLALIDIAKQFFVATATWGLDDWEKFLGIGTDTSMTENFRRERIINKINANDTVTAVFLTNLLNQYLYDGSGTVNDIPNKYLVEFLYHGGQVTSYETLRKAIRTYLPAHLGYKLITITQGNTELHSGGTVQCFHSNVVDSSLTYQLSIRDTVQYHGGAVIHIYKSENVFGGGANE